MTTRNLPYLAIFSLLALCLLSQEAVGAACEEQYMMAYPTAPATLECSPFPGSSTLHGIVYGCNSVNQGEEAPAGIVTQSFTQMCVAAVSSDTNFTCYDMAPDTDYTNFEASVASISDGLTCVAGDESEEDGPIYRYIEATGTFAFGGEQGSQMTAGEASTDFDPDLAAGVYYAATIEEGEPLVTNAPDDGMTNSSDMMSGNETEAPGGSGGDGGGDTGGDGGGDTGGDSGGGDSSTNPPSSASLVGHGSMVALVAFALASWISLNC